MSWRDLFRRIRPQTPVRKTPLREPIPIARPAAYQPVPTASSDELDADVTALWLAFQRREQPASWSAFIAHLTTENAHLQEQIGNLRTRLANTSPHRTFVP